MSQSAYAKRRGVSKMAVSNAIATGRLVKCVVLDEYGTGKIGNPDMADQEWDANTDLTKAPAYVKDRAVARGPGRPTAEQAATPDALTAAEAAVRVKHWDAMHRELDFKKAAGELTMTADVAQATLDVFSEVKTKILGVVHLLRQRDPTISPDQIALVTLLLREALAALSGE